MGETVEHLHFEGMTWPNPDDPSGVQGRLRYGTPSKSDLLVAASFMSAYAHLIGLPQGARNDRVRSIRAAATAVSSEPVEGDE